MGMGTRATIIWKKTKERFLKQKVDWIIGGIDLKTHREIHRPIYGLTKTETKEICEVTKYHLNKTGFKAQVLFHWSEDKSCYIIDVKIIGYWWKVRFYRKENKYENWR